MSSSDVERLKQQVRDLKLQLESVLARLAEVEAHCWPQEVATNRPRPDAASGSVST